MKNKNGIVRFVLFACFSGLMLISCVRPANVLSPKKMENLLVDMHKLEGTLGALGFENNNPVEKREYYAAILKKYNVKQADFDSSLVWYTKHPKQFQRLYASVSVRMDSLNNEVLRHKYHPIDSVHAVAEMSLWNKPIRHVFTKDSVRTSLNFELKDQSLMTNDLYELSFIRRVAPADSSVQPFIVMYINYYNGKKDSIFTKTYNDSITRKYSLQLRARKNLKIKSVSGTLLGAKKVKGKMNAYVDSIKVIRKYNPYRQDSLRKLVNKLDKTVIKQDTVKSLPKIQDKKLKIQKQFKRE